MKEFSIKDIERILGIQRDRIQPWIVAGYVVPSIKRARRRGSKNIFSREDLYRIYLFDSLLDYGLDRRSAAKMLLIRFEEVGDGPSAYKYQRFTRHIHSDKLREISPEAAMDDGSYPWTGEDPGAANGQILHSAELVSDASELGRMNHNDLFSLTINLVTIKRIVDMKID